MAARTGPRAGLLALLALPVLAGACASTPEQEPVAPVGIVVTPLESGRLAGGRAVFAVNAPRDVVRDEILDFAAQPAYRPTILEATPLAVREDGGTVLFRFRGVMGVDPEATCDYVVVETEEAVVIRYEMTDPSMALWALKGGFVLRRADGGAKTVIDQSFLLSALMVNRRQLLDDLRADAAAIRAHFESVEK